MQIAAALRVCVLSLCALTIQASAEEVRVVAPGAVLVLQVPAGWRSAKQPGPGPTVSLSPATGNDFQVLVSALVARDGRLAPSSGESLRGLVEAGAQAAKAQAVEQSLPIHSFGTADVQGHYFSATDRAPKPGEFKYMTQGAMSVRGLPVAFTVLSNGTPKAAVEPTLRMLAAARKE